MANEHPYQVPTSGQLIDWMNEGQLSPENYIDILEARFEDVPESLESRDLWDLLRSGRISKSTYLNNEKITEDSEDEIPPEDEWRHVRASYPNWEE